MPSPVQHDDDGKLVRPLAFQSDRDLVAAVLAGDQDSKRRMFDRFAQHVARVMARCLGANSELGDLVHDVFEIALRDLGKLRDPAALKPWMSAITVHVARGHLRHKRRRSWLWLFAPEELPDEPVAASDHEGRAAIRATYAILDKFSDDERLAFALRFIDQMELTEVAAACGVSLATIKRRLAKAQARFVAAARAHPELDAWIGPGTRWGAP
jgi:RNA polymerase sigma-70 factor, ECF subfamily